jgi:acyl carrier protein
MDMVMEKKSKKDVLRAIEKALELGSGSVSLDAVSEDVDGWDSLGHLSILAALDLLFEGRVTEISAITTADSIPKILDTLKQHTLLE